MLVDYHNHTPLCNHAEGEPSAFVERAIELQIAEIGFSEHSPWMVQEPDEKLAPTEEEFVRFVEWIRALQTRYNDDASSPIRVRLGIEMDYVPDRVDRARKYIDKYPWDYIIGSVHHLNSWGFDNPAYVGEFDRRDIDEVYEAYFASVCTLAELGIVDVIGHLDLVKKFGHRPKRDTGPLYQYVASVLRRAGVAVELNTSGRDKTVREFYPSFEFLKILTGKGVPLTLGSDAHRPDEVGRYFREARTMLLDLGVTEIVAFEKRQQQFVPL